MDKTICDVRTEIKKFAEEMERTMSKHDATKGDSWITCDISYLYARLGEEVKDLAKLIEKDSLTIPHFSDERNLTTDLIEDKLIDLANFSMMVWNRLKKS